MCLRQRLNLLSQYPSSMIPILTPAQSAEWDARAAADGRALRLLMELAGRAVANVVVERLADAASRGVLVLTGRGNNGGDGWVVARALHRLGAPVTVRAIGEPTTAPAADARRVALADGVRERPVDEDWGAPGVIVDALVGRGVSGPLRRPVLDLMTRLRATAAPVVSVDGPSGLDLATGVDHGHLLATHTVCFGGIPRGLLRARERVGQIHVRDIGLPPADAGWPRLFDHAEARRCFRPLGVADHKGDRGRVVIVGGHAGMSGAARFAARAAFAAGAGLVHVLTDADTAALLAVAEPDVQARACEAAAGLSDADRATIAAAGVVLIGPGLGRDPGSAALVEAIIPVARRVVLDADALRAFAGRVPELARLAGSTPCILTPHGGEFAALFPQLDLDDPWAAAVAACDASGAAVLLKGVPTVIASQGVPPWTTARGNPGLATGGSGDMLAGLIAAFWCRHDDAGEAATLGALALGAAADHHATRHGARGLRPADVIAALPGVWRDWAAASGVPVAADLATLDPPTVV